MQPVDCRKDQTKTVNAPLKLTLETYQQSFGKQSFCSKVIPSLLTANMPFLDSIICIHKHQGRSVSEAPLFTSSVRQITYLRRVLALSAGMLWLTDPSTNFRHIEPDFLTFLLPACFPRFPWCTISNIEILNHAQQLWAESYAVICMN